MMNATSILELQLRTAYALRQHSLKYGRDQNAAIYEDFITGLTLQYPALQESAPAHPQHTQALIVIQGIDPVDI